MEKRGESSPGGEDIVWPQVTFILLSLLVFSILIAFVYKASTGALVYEEAYAKQIGLFLDNAEPGMQISLDFKRALDIAKKNNLNKENIVIIDKGKVRVALSNSGAYEYAYFSNYKIDKKIEGEKLVLTIEKRSENAQA